MVFPGNALYVNFSWSPVSTLGRIETLPQIFISLSKRFASYAAPYGLSITDTPIILPGGSATRQSF